MNETNSGIIFERGKVFTRNLVPGKSVYGELLKREGGKEYRVWEPSRSKFCAALKKGLKNNPLKKGMNVLYLGASTGTTVSHISDILEKTGYVFAVEFAPIVLRELIFLSEQRSNIIPLMGNANHPERYSKYLKIVDIVYQDISQKNQVEIFKKNCDFYLKKGGFGILCLKAKSIDAVKKPKEVFRTEEEKLRQSFEIIEKLNLEPFELDHMFYVVKKKD